MRSLVLAAIAAVAFTGASYADKASPKFFHATAATPRHCARGVPCGGACLPKGRVCRSHRDVASGLATGKRH